MAQNPFEEAGREFRRIMDEHARHMHDEMGRAREQLEEGLSRLRREMEAAQEEIENAMGHGTEALNAARKYRERFGAWPERKGRKRPPRGLEGGQPVPVKPRPKPTPLMDGAEAPLD